MEEIILRSGLCPGDVCMLTAAVKMLDDQHPDKFLIGYKGTASALFDHNPHIRTSEGREVETHYPLIHHSNQRPVHFLQGYVDFLADQLRVPLTLTTNRPDIHLSIEERMGRGLIHEKTGHSFPYWIINAGGKHDFTLKWWVQSRWQELVDMFRGKICFVQIGSDEHHHPDLKGVIDARGTNIRELVDLVYHSQGVVTPVSFPMHLSAGVPTKSKEMSRRPCVVIAGGREPVHWELYPWHRHIHTIGSLPCCTANGCWKSQEKDCDYLVDIETSPERKWPRCMDMIGVGRVAAEILSYFLGGTIQYLTKEQSEILENYYETPFIKRDRQEVPSGDDCGYQLPPSVSEALRQLGT